MNINVNNFSLNDRKCKVYSSAGDGSSAGCLIVQAVDKEWIERERVVEETPAAHVQAVDREWIERATSPLDIEAENIIRGFGGEVIFANFGVERWNDELSPWRADAVYKNQPFSGEAQGTLEFVTGTFIPKLKAVYGLASDIKIVIGGYSLAGLFSLWAAYRTDIFHAVAAVSPSVWFPGWTEFAAKNCIHAGRVYLSLGDREEKTGNRVMAMVGENIRLQKDILDGQAIANVLEWNEGNHFKDVEKRVASGFLWTLLND